MTSRWGPYLLRRPQCLGTRSLPRQAAVHTARLFSTSPSRRAPPPAATPDHGNGRPPPPPPPDADHPAERITHFGFRNIAESEKEARVGAVFSSVASSYDTMNDLMSLGIHRLWKDRFVRSIDPGRRRQAGPGAGAGAGAGQPEDTGWTILDVAGGTGDIAVRMLAHAARVHGDERTRVTVADINNEMLAEGRKRLLASASTSTSAASYHDRLTFTQANAEHLTVVASDSLDLYTVAFGIRNFTDKAAALREAFRVLKPGGVFACLEFGKVPEQGRVLRPLLDALYQRWSFAAIPLIGQLVAGDRESYQYLVESIRRFPSQERFCHMIQLAGFVVPGRGWENLTGGIAAIHKGVKPLLTRT
ncbi:MAG: 2-hexaprenyl-6-methoxy-1,4-benzoquinone methyltransferase [Phylliscum demangeonii]|nr:MAG: 2-hexaprenyl-6-methoxy-1,4-benzoquinone methyltransferase [Phylliscum demangeonii]